MRNPPTLNTETRHPGLLLGDSQAYLLAAGCVGLALVLRMALDPIWASRLPYGLFFLAVIIVAQFARVGPALLACFAGYFLGNWFFVGPRHSLWGGDPVYRFNSVIYFIVCAMVIYFSERMRRALARERAAAAEHERLAAELQQALSEVKTLSGMLPICSYCKKIRDDKGYWTKLEKYLNQHAGADFTHSVCPDCADAQFSKFKSDSPVKST